ncbi:MAG: chemotaxis protein CheW [Bdellovibrionales bacterium]|nr:chemotaxis protein CheW [Bdellovibrionales bacterium]
MSSTGSAVNEIINDFLIESEEGISTINQGLTQLEAQPENIELINEVYRAMHTLKGSACFFQFVILEKITHFAETILDEFRSKQRQVTPEAIDLILLCMDQIQDHMKHIEANGNEKSGDVTLVEQGLQDALEKVNKGEKPGKPMQHEVLVATPEVNPQVETQSVVAFEAQDNVETDSQNFVEPIQKEESLQKSEVHQAPKVELQENVSVSKEDRPITQEVVPSEVNLSIQEMRSESKSISDSAIRVNVSLLDKIMNIAGELVLNRNQILQFANEYDNVELNRLASQLDIITTELQSDIMTTRMQPVGLVFNKFERIIRDLARSNDKKVTLTIEGKETELDKTLLEAIKDPLTHIIRNAVDHGIELPEDRKKSGKRDVGSISIKAYHESGQVTIEVSDDGKGLSKDKILQKAIDKGLISQENASRLHPKEILSFIFTPGFSTAEKVTNISGRGVGMDVVKTNIEKIGGLVDISSVEGSGTTITLKIPLTLAIIPALIVNGKEDSFAVPQNNIVELVRLEGDKRKEIERVKDSSFFRLRGELIPIIYLNEVLRLDEKKYIVEGEFKQSTEEKSSDFAIDNIVVLNAEGNLYGLVVDKILDTQEIVVKPLSMQIKDLSMFAGATIMGDGEVALIIDALGAAQYTRLTSVSSGADSLFEENKVMLEDIQSYLLFKLQSESSFAVPLALVNRLEEIETKDIEFVGVQPIIRYRDEAMPLICLSSELGYSKSIHEFMERRSEAPVLVVKHHNRLFGILVEQIIDITDHEGNIDHAVSGDKALFGSVFVNEKAITVVDVFHIIDRQEIVKRHSDGKSLVKNVEKKILVVEDSPMFRKLAVTLMEDEGYKVISAINGLDALRVLETESVDLVLSDIEMPQMDGFVMAEEIKKNEKTKHLPMIAVTTRFSDADQERGRKVGYDHYLEKFKREEIAEIVGSYLKKAG